MRKNKYPFINKSAFQIICSVISIVFSTLGTVGLGFFCITFLFLKDFENLFYSLFLFIYCFSTLITTFSLMDYPTDAPE